MPSWFRRYGSCVLPLDLLDLLDISMVAACNRLILSKVNKYVRMLRFEYNSNTLLYGYLHNRTVLSGIRCDLSICEKSSKLCINIADSISIIHCTIQYKSVVKNDQRPVSPKNDRRLRLFFNSKTGGCVAAGHVKKKTFQQKNHRSRLSFFGETGLRFMSHHS